MNEPVRTSSIGFFIALLGGVAAIAIMNHASAGGAISAGVVIAYFWVASPFLVLCGLNLYCLKAPATHALRFSAAITSCVVFLSVFLYANAAFSSHSSTAALIFIFLPAWSLAGAGATLLFSFLLSLWLAGNKESGV
jgi:hypothetical protein